MSSEARTGIIVVLVFGILVVAWTRLGGVGHFLRRQYQVIVCFDDLRGLTAGTDVRLAGVKIGEVSGVTLDIPPRIPGLPATATLLIADKYSLCHHDIFQIASGSLMGDKYLSVTRGQPPGTLLSHTQPETVAGAGPAGLEALTSKAEAVTSAAQKSLAGVNGVIGNPQTQQDLRSTIRNLYVMSERAALLATKALAVVDRLSPQDANRVSGMVDNLYEVSRSLRLTAAGLNAMTATSTIPDDIQTTTHNLAESSESIKKTAATVEQLTSDPKTSSDIRETLENVRAMTAEGTTAVAKTTAVMEKVDRIAGRVDRLTGGFGGAGKALSRMDYRGQLDVQLGSGSASRADLNVDIYPNRYKDGFWRLGLRDIGDGNGLNLQRGFPLPHRGESLRLGLIGGQVGMGWDRQWTPRLASEAELFDPGDLRLDIRARYQYDPDWDFLAGVDSLFNHPEPFVGARRKFDF